ncbi:MAG: hypothetical protein FJX39_01195 [Alphaproteobacteria bacterium]|nr:hypothetical protein [Alphaproteobacteria bacterium]
MTNTSLIISPLVSIYFLVPLLFISFIYCIYLILGQKKGCYFRVLAIIVLGGALLDPAIEDEKRQSQKSYVSIVVDRSDSQKLGRRLSQTDEALDLLKKRLIDFPSIEPKIIDIYTTDGGVSGTRLFDSLRTLLKDIPSNRLSGIILLTDGVIQDIPKHIEQLEIAAPLHAFVTGNADEYDRRIELVESPRFGIVGKQQIIRARIIDTGNAKDRVKISVKKDGQEIQSYSPVPGDIVNIKVNIDHAGANIIELETPVASNELTPNNNKAFVSIEGARDQLKVLLVSGEPNPGERSWRNLLRSDPNVELVHFTILRPPEKVDPTPASELSLIAFPTADLFGPKINEFDLIIFDRYFNQTFLPSTYFENVKKYINNGGAFLAVVGPDYATTKGIFYSPLETILPAKPTGAVVEQAFRPSISKLGERHPVTRDLNHLNNLPQTWGHWFRQVEGQIVAGSPILNGANDLPLLVVSRQEKGRVALLLSDQIWLWSRGFDGGGPYTELSRKLAHWLMKEPELEEEAITARVDGNQVLIIRQTMQESVSPVTITSPSGATRTVELSGKASGLWQAHLSIDELGLWRFTTDKLSTSLQVGSQITKETEDLISSTETLQSIALATGGSVRRLEKGKGEIEFPRLLQLPPSKTYQGLDWIALKDTHSSELIGLKVFPLAIGFGAMCILMLFILIAWFSEGYVRKISK